MNPGSTFLEPTFTNIMNTCIPQSKPRIYKNIYITHDAIHLKNVKNKLWKRYTRTRLPSDHEAFCAARNELRSYTRLLRHNFELGITNDIKLNPKKFWQYVKSRLNTSVTIDDIRNDNNDLVTNDYDKAELFNSYFCVFTDEDSHSLPPFGVSDTVTPIDTVDISLEVVYQKLSSVNISKSAGPDGWPPIVLKETADSISLPLYILFTISL